MNNAEQENVEIPRIVHSLDRAGLSEILRIGQHLLDKKSEQEILEITFQDHTANLVISDGIAMVAGQLQTLESVSKSHRIVLNPHEMYERIRKIDSERIGIDITSTEVIIEYSEVTEKKVSEHGSFNITQLNIPSPPEHTEQDLLTFTIDHDLFVQNLKMIKPTMAIDDIRDQFRGVSVIVKSDEITLWSSDGIKIAVTKINCNSGATLSGIWPRRLVDAICSISGFGEATIRMSKKQAKYEINGFTIISPLVNATLLDYEKIFNRLDLNYTELIVDAGYFSKKLDKILVVSRNEGAALLVIDEVCRLSCIASNQSGKAEVEFTTVNVPNKSLQVYLNPSTLLGFLRNFKGNVAIRIYPDSHNIVILKENANELSYPLYLTKLMRNRANHT